MTRNERAAKVEEAVAALPAALRRAVSTPEPDDLDAWEAVEKLGATVHRQARLLAGKSKGG